MNNNWKKNIEMEKDGKNYLCECMSKMEYNCIRTWDKFWEKSMEINYSWRKMIRVNAQENQIKFLKKCEKNIKKFTN